MQDWRHRATRLGRFFFYWLTKGPCISSNTPASPRTAKQPESPQGGRPCILITSNPVAAGFTAINNSRQNLDALDTPSIHTGSYPTGSKNYNADADGESSPMLDEVHSSDHALTSAEQSNATVASISVSRECRCLACVLDPLSAGKYRRLRDLYRFPSSSGKPGFKCAEQNCHKAFSTVRDLQRHYRAKHCTKTPDFPCPAVGCSRGGDNGFHREDKLASHHKSMHQGWAISTKKNQRILPAPPKNGASGSSSQHI